MPIFSVDDWDPYMLAYKFAADSDSDWVRSVYNKVSNDGSYFDVRLAPMTLIERAAFLNTRYIRYIDIPHAYAVKRRSQI
jgi:hypothetical protein